MAKPRKKSPKKGESQTEGYIDSIKQQGSKERLEIAMNDPESPRVDSLMADINAEVRKMQDPNGWKPIVFAGPQIQRVDLGAAPMVTLDSLDVGEVVGVDGAFVKWAPTVPSSRKAEVDPAAVRKTLQERGAVGVLVAPLMQRAEVKASAPAPLPSASPREALEEWLREQDAPEEVRVAALHEADAILAEEKL